MIDIDARAREIYDELGRLRAMPDISVPGEKSEKQKRIEQLEAALAAFGLAAKARGR